MDHPSIQNHCLHDAQQPNSGEICEHSDGKATQQPTKRRRVLTTAEEENILDITTPNKAPASCKLLPSFYDSLSSICLTHRALREFNRRTRLANRQERQVPVPAPRREQSTTQSSLAEFARHGGPDLTDLRGFSLPTMPPKKVPFTPGEGPAPVAAGSSQSSSSAAALSSSRRSSAYDGNFEFHMDDFKILGMAQSSRPSNLAEVMAALRAPREEARDAVTEDGLTMVQDAYEHARDEDDVVAAILPLVAGPRDWFEHKPSLNVLCNNLTPLTNNTIVSIKPNMYYGAPFSQLAPDVRAALAAHIIPTAAASDRPLLPNFFVEIKGPSGTDIVALRQVRYDGAVGARAMHSLQNYAAVRDGLPRSAHVYDGRVRALSVTLFSDRLRIFGHHITAPAPGESRPTYHMTRLGGWLLTEEFDQFRQGVYAYRNARDLARRFRDELIAEANNVARISGVGMTTEEANEAATVFPDTTGQTGQTGQTDQTDQTDQTNSRPSMAPPAEPASRVASKRPLDFTTADANDSGPASKTSRSSHRTNATDANNEAE